MGLSNAEKRLQFTNVMENWIRTTDWKALGSALNRIELEIFLKGIVKRIANEEDVTMEINEEDVTMLIDYEVPTFLTDDYAYYKKIIDFYCIGQTVAAILVSYGLTTEAVNEVANQIAASGAANGVDTKKIVSLKAKK